MPALKDLVGQRFGKLVVIKQNYDEEYKEKSHAIWECKCDCGKIVYIPSYHLIRGDNISCGCSHISQGELKIHNILKNNNIFFEREKTFYDCKFNNNYLARFDFYVEDKYIIEYDGSQHLGITKIMDGIQKNIMKK